MGVTARVGVMAMARSAAPMVLAAVRSLSERSQKGGVCVEEIMEDAGAISKIEEVRGAAGLTKREEWPHTKYVLEKALQVLREQDEIVYSVKRGWEPVHGTVSEPTETLTATEYELFRRTLETVASMGSMDRALIKRALGALRYRRAAPSEK